MTKQEIYYCHCADCLESDNVKGKKVPMLHKELWLKVAKRQKNRVLCRPCFEKRLGRFLVVQDLKTDVIFNYLFSSWFEDIAPPLEAIEQHPEVADKLYDYVTRTVESRKEKVSV